jgi:hypothetical protein
MVPPSSSDALWYRVKPIAVPATPTTLKKNALNQPPTCQKCKHLAATREPSQLTQNEIAKNLTRATRNSGTPQFARLQFNLTFLHQRPAISLTDFEIAQRFFLHLQARNETAKTKQ